MDVLISNTANGVLVLCRCGTYTANGMPHANDDFSLIGCHLCGLFAICHDYNIDINDSNSCASVNLSNDIPEIERRMSEYYRNIYVIDREFTEDEQNEVESLVQDFCSGAIFVVEPMNIHYLQRLTEEEFRDFSGVREDLSYERITLENYQVEELFAIEVSCSYCNKHMFVKTTSPGYML